jgi:hypothetical protein
MDHEEEYEPEQEAYQEDPNFITEGEYLDGDQPEHLHPGMMGGPHDPGMYFEQESQEMDVQAILEDIESSLGFIRNDN